MVNVGHLLDPLSQERSIRPTSLEKWDKAVSAQDPTHNPSLFQLIGKGRSPPWFKSRWRGWSKGKLVSL